MTRRRVLLGLALAVMAGPVWAHALPGTVIRLDVSGGEVIVQASVPLDELKLALPEAAGMGQSLRAADEAVLRSYFEAHVRVMNGDDVAFRVAEAAFSLFEAENDHVGVYQAMVVDIMFIAPIDAGLQDLRLEYDAVIHKVRNHKVGVIRVESGTDIPAGVIAYDFALKTVPPLALASGPEQP